ncbi:O-antigen ligase family protein [Gallibacterium trehalosifermentans]|uniref:O-antigen ligase family protein n=1 Tax=Gallibacterium trehalosifermentans TaxID=516935 RepID=A0ABV6GY45_9PAST
MNIIETFYHRYIFLFFNFIISYFFIALVIIPKAYSSGVILIIFSVFLIIYSLIKNKSILVLKNKNYYFFIAPFFIYFFLYISSIFIHHDSIKVLDNASRGICFLLLFLLIKVYPLSLKNLLYSIPLSGILTGCYAFYQKFFLHYDRALSDTTYVIQSGDMAMSIGMFSLALMFYCWRNKQYYLTFLCILGTFGGMLGSFLSATRGGWLLMPFIILTLFYFNRHILTKKIILSFFVSLLAIISVLLMIPSAKMLSQIERAYIEVVNSGKASNSNTSVGARLDLWKASILMITEKPMLGWGEKGAKDRRKELGNLGKLATYPANLGHAHNQYLNDFLERGIFGFFALLGIFLLPLYAFIRDYKKYKENEEVKLFATLGIIHITSVMSYGLTQVFFAHNSGNMFYFFLTVLFYAMLLSHKKQRI